MSCSGDASDIGIWATGMWTNLGQPADISALTISGWAAQAYTVGQLNAYTNQCFSGQAGAYVCPDLQSMDFSILGAMYALQFYNYRAQLMAGAGGVATTFTRLQDGDSIIQRASPGELMKAYVSMAKDAQKALLDLIAFVNDFSQSATIPRGVIYPTIVNTWGYGGYGAYGSRPVYYRN